MIDSDRPNTNQHITPSCTRTDDSSDSEIESISSTCTFALNYKLPARYVYPRNVSGSGSDATSSDTMTPATSNPTAASHSTVALTSVSNSSKRTRDDMEAENDDDEEEVEEKE